MSEKVENLKQLEQWKSVVADRFPTLSKPQAVVLALWSFGILGRIPQRAVVYHH